MSTPQGFHTLTPSDRHNQRRHRAIESDPAALSRLASCNKAMHCERTSPSPTPLEAFPDR